MSSAKSAFKVALQSQKQVGSPRKDRSKVVEQARLELTRNMGSFVDRLIRGKAKIKKFNAEERIPPRRKLVTEAYSRARKVGRFLTVTEQLNIERLGSAGIPNDIGLPPIPDGDEFPIIPPGFRKEFSWYEELHERVHQTYLGGATACGEPDLDEVTPTAVTPGLIVTLNGTCFGDQTGSVELEILPYDPQDIGFPNVVTLQIYSWSSTLIEAFLPADFGGFPARADCGIWARTATGNPSNALPVAFTPRMWLWGAEWVKNLNGGAVGDSADGTLLAGRVLGDPAFSIERAEAHDSGSGHGELVPPMAGGQNLAQGWHMGAPAFGAVTLRILYRLRGPAGMEPPAVGTIGPWGLFGET